MKTEEFSLLLGDIRDDFVARAHEPVRPRRAAPTWHRWSAAACLCLVTAIAVLLTAHYLRPKAVRGPGCEVSFRNGCIPKWGTGSRRKPGR